MPLPTLRTVAGQPSWTFNSDRVEAALTKLGGHLGPVRFRLGRKTVQPFSVAPWAEESLDSGTLPLLRVLRGDFFCCPFGGNSRPWRGERHPVHGESANATWSLAAVDRSARTITLTATLAPKVRRCRIEKAITLVDGETVVYQRHTITGGRGPINLGHHAMLTFPSAAGSGRISTSPFVHAQVFPGEFESPAAGGYQSLKAGASFRSLERVPLAAGGFADLTRYPARAGYEDLVMMTAHPKLPLAWTAVAFPSEGYVWFALRDPRILRQTIFWISNGGRHYAPWNGRHTGVMGLEDVTSYFHQGLAESVEKNALNRKGIPTSVTLSPTRPFIVPYIMGVAAIPAGFERVEEIEPDADGIVLRARGRRTARCAVDLKRLQA